MLELYIKVFHQTPQLALSPVLACDSHAKSLSKVLGCPLYRATGDGGSVAGVESLNLMSGFYFSLAFCMRCLWMVWLTRTGADRCCHAPQQKAFCSGKTGLKPTEQYGLNQLMNHRKAGSSPVPAKCSHPRHAGPFLTQDCWSTPRTSPATELQTNWRFSSHFTSSVFGRFIEHSGWKWKVTGNLSLLR